MAVAVSTFNAHAQAGRDAAEQNLADLEAIYLRMIARCAREAAREFTGAVTAAGWQPPPEGNVLSAATIARIVQASLIGRTYRKIVRAQVGETLGRVGISFTVRHPLLANLLATAGMRTGEALGEAVQPILRETIAQAFVDGLSVRDTADQIRERITEASPAQAHMLARTDLNGLANGGSVASAKLAGVGYKQWLTAEDDRVRPEHEEADGQTVPVDQPFQVCGESLDFPGDPAGSNECTCNCRCSVVYLDASEVASSAPVQLAHGSERGLLRGEDVGAVGMAPRAARHAKRNIGVGSLRDQVGTHVSDHAAGLSTDDLVAKDRVPVRGSLPVGVGLGLVDAADSRNLSADVDKPSVGVHEKEADVVRPSNVADTAPRATDRDRAFAVDQTGKVGKPTGVIHATDSSSVIGQTAAVAPPVVRWTSDIAFEGAATDDGRYILPAALDWRELPLTLMALTTNEGDGHTGSFVAGRIDAIKRDRRRNMDGDPLEPGVTAIRAEGVFDMQGENGAEVARLVDDETVRGVSIDMAVQETVLRDPDTGEIVAEDGMALDRLFAGELQFAVKAGTILAATVCPTPAFANARIAVTASGDRVLRVTAPFRVVVEAVTAAAAGLAPAKPPKAWFETKEADGPRPLTVDAHGRVSGHIAVWDSCHTGKSGVCFRPPNSPSGYAYFNLGEVECADGSRVACGQITLDTEHAPLSATGRGAKSHYEHTGVCAADVRARDGRYGIWVAGAVRPGVTETEARALMAAKPSGDWRSMTPGGPLELIGILAVNVPGFPVPRPEARLVASAEHPDGEPVALVAAGLDAEPDGFDRRLRVLGARAEGGIDALADLAGV